jgi:hypothetical protein
MRQFTANIVSDTIALLEARAHDGHDAGRIVDTLFMGIFVALKRDKEFTIPHDRFDVLVADVVRDAEQILFTALNGHVPLAEACDAVLAYFPVEGDC